MVRKLKEKKRRKKNGRKLNKVLFLIFIVVLLGITGYVIKYKYIETLNIEKLEYKYLASSNQTVIIYQLKEINLGFEPSEEIHKILKEVKQIVRGTKVQTTLKKLEYQDKLYQQIIIDGVEYYVEEDLLVSKKEKIVLEDFIYIRSATSMLESTESSKIVGLVDKGTKLEVIDYDNIDNVGNVNLYKVKLEDKVGYVYGDYVTYTKEAAIKNYMADTYDVIHSKIKNTYNGGDAIKLDFYPNEKPNFKNNKMPDSVYALYLNCSSNTINNIDKYIEFAKDTKINAFVVDIKDNESPAYPAKTFKELSPTNYKYAINSYESYKNAITKLKDAGFYVIGRITTFKDSYYIQDHPDTAILDKSTNQPYLHNGSYWPSVYNRDVWYYTISLAKESVKEFGFNEINFDYVRFPDRMNGVINKVDLKNIYNEDKAQAVQRFVQYAKDALHELGVYVSVDVFGETTNSSYVTAYGQYWPAISNVVDVISGMPYPDHFASGSYGLKKPWNNPYQLMKYWGTYANDRQKEIPTPAKVRTWIQAYDVMKYVDFNSISYNAKEVEQEIRGLYDAGLTDGYITWLSNSSLEKYQLQKQAFQIDYWKEYKNGKSNNGE